MAGRALPADRPPRAAPRTAHRRRGRSRPGAGGDAPGPRAARPDLAGTGRAGAAAAAGHRPARERAGAARHHRPALRGRPGPPHPAGDPGRDRRDAGGPRLLPAHRPPPTRGVPHQRGARRFPRPGTHPGTHRTGGSGLRPDPRRRPRRNGLHHPHPRPGRHRPVPGRHGPPLLRRRRRPRPAARCQHPAGPRAGRRGQPEHVQHGQHGAAARAAGQRGVPAPRPGPAGHVPGAVARVRRRGGADHLRHQRCARPDLVGPGDQPALRGRRLGVGTRQQAARGRTDHRRVAVGDPLHPAGTARRRGAAEAAGRLAAPGSVRTGTGLDRVGVRPGRPHHRLRPPRPHLQAADADAARPGPAAVHPARPGPAGAARGGRQVPPRRRGRQGTDPTGGALRRRPRGAAPDRLPARLRHVPRPVPLLGLRRVVEQPAAPAGGLRHVRDEGGAQRRPEPVRAGRVVGRVPGRSQRLVHPHRRRGHRPPTAGRPGGLRALPLAHRRGDPVVLRAAGGRRADAVDVDGAPHPDHAGAQGAGQPDGARVRRGLLPAGGPVGGHHVGRRLPGCPGGGGVPLPRGGRVAGGAGAGQRPVLRRRVRAAAGGRGDGDQPRRAGRADR